jgi:hypothetical protein
MTVSVGLSEDSSRPASTVLRICSSRDPSRFGLNHKYADGFRRAPEWPNHSPRRALFTPVESSKKSARMSSIAR